MNRTAVRRVEKRARRSNNTAQLEQMGAHYMAPLPAELRPSVPKTRSMESYVKSFITARSDVQQVYAQKIQARSVLALDNPSAPARAARDRPERKTPRTERRAKYSAGVTWPLCRALHALWQSYMRDLLGERVHEGEFMNKLLKADLHGCVLKVIQARNVSQIGREGVLVSESERTFQLATAPRGTDLALDGAESATVPPAAPRVLIVPKAHTVFALRWGDRLVTIYGNHFMQRSADRSAKKFKGKDTIEL